MNCGLRTRVLNRVSPRSILIVKEIASGAESLEGDWDLGEYFADISIDNDGKIIMEIFLVLGKKEARVIQQRTYMAEKTTQK